MSGPGTLTSRLDYAMWAGTAVFVGVLLSDLLFGDGVQTDDFGVAAMAAVAAAWIQYHWFFPRRE